MIDRGRVRVRMAVALAGAVASLLVGCGGDDAATTSTSTPEESSGAEAESTTSTAPEEETVEGDGFTVTDHGEFLAALVEGGQMTGFAVLDESTVVVVGGSGGNATVSRLDLENGERVDRELRAASPGFRDGEDPMAPVVAGGAVWIGQPPTDGTRDGIKFNGASRVVGLDAETLEPTLDVDLPDAGVLEHLVAAGDGVVAFYRTAPKEFAGSAVVDQDQVRWRLQALSSDGQWGPPVDLGGYRTSGVTWSDDVATRVLARAVVAGSPDGTTLLASLHDHLQLFDLTTLEPIGPAVPGPSDDAAGEWSGSSPTALVVGDGDLAYVSQSDRGLRRLVSLPDLADEGAPELPIVAMFGDDAVALGGELQTPMSSLLITPFALDGSEVGEEQELRIDCVCGPLAVATDDDHLWVLTEQAIVRVPVDEALRTLR